LEGLVKGDVVIRRFPYSDFSQLKLRPALVLAVLPGNDIILCEITTKSVRNQYAISVTNADFTSGSLIQDSNIRTDKITTSESFLIRYKVGSLKL
jgi:mRNA interferase MazF